MFTDLMIDKYWENNFFRDLGDPEYIPTEKARLTWTFKGVRGTPENPNRDKIIRSPPAFVGGYWWRGWNRFLEVQGVR